MAKQTGAVRRLPAKAGQALARRLEPGALQVAAETPAETFARLARDPKVSVEKIERLMALWERGEDKRRAQEFGVAMAAAQRTIPTVIADRDNDQTRSRYASYPALDRVVRPIYSAQGFSLSFDTRPAADQAAVLLLCYVSHIAGHVREYQIEMPADGKGAKGGDVMTKTHATGSAVSYGMRYLLKMIFNIPIAGDRDDDGNRASAQPAKRDRAASASKSAPPPARSEAPSDGEKITRGSKQRPGQLERLWVIIRNSGRNEQTVRDWLLKVWGYSSTRDIKRKDYESICRAVEGQEKLPDHR